MEEETENQLYNEWVMTRLRTKWGLDINDLGTRFGRHYEKTAAEILRMIGPYIKEDPTAFCSYEDHLTGAETFVSFCLLRAESVRGQLEGEIPSTIAEQQEDTQNRVDASEIWLPDMGEIEDLKDTENQK